MPRPCPHNRSRRRPFMTTPPTVPDPIRQSGEFLEYLYGVAVRRALPLHNTAAFLPPPPSRESGGRTLVLGAGKAGGAMAQAVEALWPAHAPLSGLVVTRYHHTPPRPQGLAQRIEVVEAAHPVPDAAGLAAAQRILALTQGLTENDLVLCLISGGGAAPPPPPPPAPPPRGAPRPGGRTAAKQRRP